MSIMASWDWPEKWPGLVENLTVCLAHDDLNLVHGAMKTLDMFASDKNLTDVHIPLLVEVVFPQLQRIFGEQQYPERIRMRAIRILYSIISWLGTIKSEYPQPIAAAVKPTLSVWYDLFIQELSKPDEFGVGHGSKIGVLLVIHQLLAHFPDFLKSKNNNAIEQLLGPLWNSLTSAVDIWERTSVYDDQEDNSGYDSDAGDEISFRNYVCMLVEVFTAIDEKRKFQPLLSAGLIDLCSISLRLVQLSNVQASLFTDDPSQFLDEENEENSLTFSLRGQTARLIQMLAVSLDGHGIEALGAAVQRNLQELAELEQTAMTDGDSAVAVYNRRREGLLYGVGTALKSWSESSQFITLSGSYAGGASPSDVPFDVRGFIQLLMVDCDSQDLILRGRALWCASIALRMTSESAEIEEMEERPEVSDETTAYLVRAATDALQIQEPPLPLLLHAAACLTQLSPLLDEGRLRETISVALPLLSSLAPELNESSLHGLVETIEAWVELDADSTVQHAAQVLSYLMSCWSLNTKDPYLPSLLSSVVSKICSIPEALPIAQQTVGAVVHQIYQDPSSKDNGLIEGATDMLSFLFLDADFSSLPHLITQHLIPQLFSIMLSTIDNSMLHSGCTALVSLVRCAKDDGLSQLDISSGIHSSAYADPSSGQYGISPYAASHASHSSNSGSGFYSALDGTVAIVDRVLNAPELDDHSALFVGSLISKLIDTCSASLGPDRTHTILQFTVLRLERVELNTLIQDLIQVFALLMRQNLDLVLQFLTSFHVPSTGELALNYVLSFWTKTFEDRHGNYQMKVSILALSSIFGHDLLTNILVPADAAIEDALAQKEEAIGSRTRSKKRVNPALPRSEPINTRIFRLMIREHMWLMEEKDAPAEMSSDEDEFSHRLDAEDQGDADQASPFADANDFDYAQDGGDYRGTISLDQLFQSKYQLDDEETDPDILNDPAYSLDIEQYIYDWMKSLATEQVELFDYCVSQLASNERNHLIDRLIKSREE